jgi:hypothetical protein|tara:strand:- start:305 stop:709 length:405 start_codon:yes stop_codon:yes gene_type:complete
MAQQKLGRKDYTIAVKTETPKVITGATNATPIVITSVGHKLASTQKVTISGVVGNTNSNGLKTVTVIDANTFSIVTAGNASYTSGGEWVTAEGVRFKKEASKGELFYDTGENKLYIATTTAGSSDSTLKVVALS